MAAQASCVPPEPSRLDSGVPLIGPREEGVTKRRVFVSMRQGVERSKESTRLAMLVDLVRWPGECEHVFSNARSWRWTNSRSVGEDSFAQVR